MKKLLLFVGLSAATNLLNSGLSRVNYARLYDNAGQNTIPSSTKKRPVSARNPSISRTNSLNLGGSQNRQSKRNLELQPTSRPGSSQSPRPQEISDQKLGKLSIDTSKLIEDKIRLKKLQNRIKELEDKLQYPDNTEQLGTAKEDLNWTQEELKTLKQDINEIESNLSKEDLDQVSQAVQSKLNLEQEEQARAEALRGQQYRDTVRLNDNGRTLIKIPVNEEDDYSGNRGAYGWSSY